MAAFHTTRWTRVCLAKADSEDGRRELAELCAAYYEPVVAYLRNALRDADSARDVAHAFFTDMLGGGKIGTADRDRGRFRSYLLGAVKHFVSHQRQSAHRLKRGGLATMVSMDDPEVADIGLASRILQRRRNRGALPTQIHPAALSEKGKPLSRSWLRLVGYVSRCTFQDRFAIFLVTASILGLLFPLGFVPGWEHLLGCFGFFGFIVAALIVEKGIKRWHIGITTLVLSLALAEPCHRCHA